MKQKSSYYWKCDVKLILILWKNRSEKNLKIVFYIIKNLEFFNSRLSNFEKYVMYSVQVVKKQLFLCFIGEWKQRMSRIKAQTKKISTFCKHCDPVAINFLQILKIVEAEMQTEICIRVCFPLVFKKLYNDRWKTGWCNTLLHHDNVKLRNVNKVKFYFIKLCC